MSNNSARVIQVLIASPSDVKEERNLIRDVLYEWNAIHAKSSNIVLLPSMYELNVAPELGSPPQDIINNDIVIDSDVLIGVFWSRFGTKTKKYLSGTEEEIDIHIKNGKPAMVYFCERGLPNDLDIEQFEKLRKFKDICQNNGVIGSYLSLEDLKSQLYRDISKLILGANNIFNSQEGEIGKFSFNNHANSSYDYSEDKNRLMVQADMLKEIDNKSIKKAVSWLPPKDSINILDIGCADGYLTYDRFSDYGKVTVCGIDNNEIAIEKAIASVDDKRFYFKCESIEDLDLYKGQFDIVFSALTFHHLENPELILNKVWDSLEPGSSLIIRAADDALKLNYPESPELEFLLNYTDDIPGSSDRKFGRKMYTMSKRLSPIPRNIEMFFDIKTTINSNSDFRSNFYTDNYSFRIKYAERASKMFMAKKNDKEFVNLLKNISKNQHNRFESDDDLFSLNVQMSIVLCK